MIEGRIQVRICSMSFIRANLIFVISVKAQTDSNKLEKSKMGKRAMDKTGNKRYRNRKSYLDLRTQMAW